MSEEKQYQQDNEVIQLLQHLEKENAEVLQTIVVLLVWVASAGPSHTELFQRSLINVEDTNEGNRYYCRIDKYPVCLEILKKAGFAKLKNSDYLCINFDLSFKEIMEKLRSVVVPIIEYYSWYLIAPFLMNEIQSKDKKINEIEYNNKKYFLPLLVRVEGYDEDYIAAPIEGVDNIFKLFGVSCDSAGEPFNMNQLKKINVKFVLYTLYFYMIVPQINFVNFVYII